MVAAAAVRATAAGATMGRPAMTAAAVAVTAGGAGSGRGSGDNIRAFTLTSWSLAPGRSGGYYRGRDSGVHYSYFGGGGGGVLVDGMGPQEDYSYQGQGYGGGGGGYQRFPQWSIGLQGVILLEMISYENK